MEQSTTRPSSNRDLTERAINTVKGEIKNLSMRDMLDLIDLFLTRRDQESANLAAVITALRGCDIFKAKTKKESTCVIRAVGLPLSCPPYNEWSNNIEDINVGDGSTCMGRAGHDTDLSRVLLEEESMDAYHFNTHMRMAAQALGLTYHYKQEITR